ncbi:uncharacterized protein [Leptinotarsa decemlineata]|uniref:uncharacterized protein n=1 Tax=Leptinotarsa decemlineata TaxID=7539 RepID=UPI003D30CA5A
MAAPRGIQLEFNPAVNDWVVHWKRLQQYFIANNITDDNIKRAILLNGLHQDAYGLLQTLCVPDEPETSSLVILTGHLDNYFKKQNVVFVERFSFYSAFKQETESAQEWSARLKKLSMYCDFGESFDTKLCDKFITGYNPGKVRNKLFSEKSSVTFSNALQVALTEEAAQVGMLQCDSEIKREPNEIDVNRIVQRNGGRKEASSSSSVEKGHSSFGGRAAGEVFRVKVKCFRCGKDHLANVCPYHFLSRLPILDADSDSKNFDFEEGIRDFENSHINLNYLSNAEYLPIDVTRMREETMMDPVLSQVVSYVKNGWPSNCLEEVKPFYKLRFEIGIEDDVLLWGHRVLVPSSLRKTILAELHSGHFGIVKTKSLARSYVWWPSLSKDIEVMVKKCQECQSARSTPEKTPLVSWPIPELQENDDDEEEEN